MSDFNFTLRSADQVRAKVARYLSDAVEVGTDLVAGDLHHVVFNTDLHVMEWAAECAVLGEGDGFPAELAELLEQADKGHWSGDKLAFRVAMALYTR